MLNLTDGASDEARAMIEEAIDSRLAQYEASQMKHRNSIWFAVLGSILTVIIAIFTLVWTAGHSDQTLRDLTVVTKELSVATANLNLTVTALSVKVEADGRRLDIIEEQHRAPAPGHKWQYVQK